MLEKSHLDMDHGVVVWWMVMDLPQQTLWSTAEISPSIIG
jgi:hypothetical protein